MEMRKLALILILIGVAFAGLAMKNKVTNRSFSEDELTKISEGNIQVTAVFLNPKYPDLKKATFYLRLDTHSGNLYRFDLKNSTVLVVGGKEFRPISWKEDERSWGHHRYGFMEFPEEALKEIYSQMSFSLKINIDGERVLKWET